MEDHPFPSLHVTDCQIQALARARHQLFERSESFGFVVFASAQVVQHYHALTVKIVNNTNPVVQRRSTSTGGLLPKV